MKYLLSIFTCLIIACGQSSGPARNKRPINNPGTVIAADSQFITEEKPNEFYFTVKIITTSAEKGDYTVWAAWGYNTAEGHLVMPKGGEHLTPVLRRSAEPYSYVAGFIFDDDTSFYDYYLIEAQKTQIKMKYIKAYTFE